MRSWSVRHARGLKAVYDAVQATLIKLHPLLQRIGYARLERPVFAVEKLAKGFLLDSQNCGQCVVGHTGLSCPMNCPKKLRNGPCGGVRPDGKCEVEPDMDCVWVLAWEGNKRLRAEDYPIQFVQAPVDNRLSGTSAWLREVRLQVAAQGAGFRNEV
jgi:hypothetical protein